ncbi:hypothetical protein AB0395_43955 [Streptosporangium sp. NPDC051023]|uniref:hypothetical protein n=1 Tax=Streptosporangium sp. NPDC051023 TaxID=3155410 RepID=UPI00344BD601
MAQATTVVRHRPVIRRSADAQGALYWLACTCGHLGVEQAARRMAQVDLDQHVLSLPHIPAAQQCRTPHAHDRQAWEPCGLCENQTALFDPAELTGEAR